MGPLSAAPSKLWHVGANGKALNMCVLFCLRACPSVLNSSYMKNWGRGNPVGYFALSRLATRLGKNGQSNQLAPQMARKACASLLPSLEA